MRNRFFFPCCFLFSVLFFKTFSAVPYRDYYEPFIGAGSVFLTIRPYRAFINDINEQLVNVYIQIKRDVEEVLAYVAKMDSVQCDKDLYYSYREQYNGKILRRELDAECAALTIWINKHCFNGLYRVNRKGLFNVPYNNKASGKSVDDGNLRAISEYLRTAEATITCLDFEKACENVRSGDFVYFDSPYVPESPTASFTDYAASGFALEDHKRLATLFKRLDQTGALLALSNNAVPLVRELYSDYRVIEFDARRAINRDASKRTGREVLVTNY